MNYKGFERSLPLSSIGPVDLRSVAAILAVTHNRYRSVVKRGRPLLAGSGRLRPAQTNPLEDRRTVLSSAPHSLLKPRLTHSIEKTCHWTGRIGDILFNP